MYPRAAETDNRERTAALSKHTWQQIISDFDFDSENTQSTRGYCRIFMSTRKQCLVEYRRRLTESADGKCFIVVVAKNECN